MMAETTQLKGMTWSDPRGYDPVVAAAEAFAKTRPGISIAWDKRSLQGFETTPVDELAARYDLMVIDHPHVGSVADQGCLLPFETHANEDALAELANQSVGRSFQSYFLHGRQWALPIDAAAQVQAHRADLSPRVDHWADVIRKAEDGLVIWPLRPPHVLMSFCTLAANLGHPCATSFGDLIDATTGLKVLAAMCAVSRHMDEAFYTMDPIAVLDELAQSGRYHLAPLVYLYKGYANEGYRSNRIHFTDMPVLGRNGPLGSALGGTGIAISANTAHPELCTEFALWLAGAECQSGLYARANGQPGNALAWSSAAVNAPVLDAYYNTRLTHETAWLRPRHDGYVQFQEEGSETVSHVLRGRLDPDAAIARLNQRFRASFKGRSTA
jgi:multiple sugar transport system substrate-binding protein